MRRLLLAAAAAAFVLSATASAQQLAPPPPGIVLQNPQQAQISPQARAQLTQLQQLRTTRSINVARIPQTLLRTPVGGAVALNLAPNVTVNTRTLTTESENGMTVWRGEVLGGAADAPPGIATLVSGENGAVTGTVQAADGRVFRLRPLADGSTAVLELNYSALPADEPTTQINRRSELAPQLNQNAIRNAQLQRPVNPGVLAQRPNATTAAPAAQSADSMDARVAADTRFSAILRAQSLSERYRLWPGIWQLLQPPTIDVLVAYTPSAQAAAGDINALATLAVAETNGSFTNSNIWAKLRLVGTMPVSYTEAGKSYDTIVADLAGTADGKMDNVHAQRNAVHADVVVLIVNQTDYCGMADAIIATAATAFVAVHWDCATGYYSFGHEIGHLLGARHDPAHDGGSPYVYGHGLEHPGSGASAWRTIMAYACSGGNCDPRVQYWSNPSINYNGTATGNAASQDNHRVWNERAATVAAFR